MNIKMLLTMKTKTDQADGRSGLGTSHDIQKGLKDCTAFCRSQDIPYYKTGKRHPLVVYSGTTLCLNVSALSLQTTAVSLFSFLSFLSTATT